MKKLSLTLLAAAALAVTASQAHAAFLITFTQSGGDLVATGSGSLNLSALTNPGSGTASTLFNPSLAYVRVGPPSGGNTISTSVYNGGGLAGPSSFGSGSNVLFPDSGSGDFVGVYGANKFLYVPQGYVSGAALSDTMTFNGQTFASVGFTPGTYTYTWGTGAMADSLTVTSVVPEPSTWAMLLGGAGVLGFMTLRGRRSARA